MQRTKKLLAKKQSKKRKKKPQQPAFNPFSLLAQQRCSLSIFLSCTESPRRSCNSCTHKHECHDGECKRPLQCHCSREELPNTQSGTQEGRSKTDMPVPKDSQEEAGKDEDTPDGHVRQHTAGQPTAAHHHRTVQQDEEEGESQWQSNDRCVDPAGKPRVTEIECDELEELYHLD